MKCNVDGLLGQASKICKGGLGFMLTELASNLKELRDRGDKAAFTEFFNLYVFDDDRNRLKIVDSKSEDAARTQQSQPESLTRFPCGSVSCYRVSWLKCENCNVNKHKPA